MHATRQRGFTLIELIVTLVVATIVMGFTAMFIGTPIQAYLAQTRRASLSDSAEAITRNIANDIRIALPNSTRAESNGAFFALEMLRADDVLRYRSDADDPDPVHALTIGTPDDQFSALGPITQGFSFVAVQDASSADPYAFTTVMAPVSKVVANATTKETDITLSSPFTFTKGSPSHSVFLVSSPVTYICDAASGTLTRYSNYPINASQSARDSDAELLAEGATRSLIATNVTACEVTRFPATQLHGDLVSLRIVLTDSGDTIPVFYQARVGRQP